MEKDDIKDYWYSIFNDALFLDEEGFFELDEYKDEFLTDEYLNSLIDKLDIIEETKSYPSKGLDKINEVIQYIKMNINNEKINEIEKKYNQIKQMTINDIFLYYEEAMIKFLDLEHISSFNDYSLDKKIIEDSILYDCVVFKDLFYHELDIEKNDLYVASLKKFFSDIPELFQIPEVKQRAIQMLEVNSNNKDAESLINDIQSGNTMGFLFSELKALYDTVLIQRMMFDKKLINERAGSLDSNQINTMYHFISVGAIPGDDIKKNVYSILAQYRNGVLDKLPQEIKKHHIDRHNGYISMLNNLNEYNYDMLENDLTFRFRGPLEIKFSKYINFSLLFKNDFDALNYMIFGKEIENISGGMYLSINKFLTLTPYIFKNKQIYERTLNLLNKHKLSNYKTKRKVKEIYGRYE